MPAAPLTSTDPLSVGGYKLLGRLGAGGMGTVYLAKDATGEDVAVKVLHPRLAADPQFLARFADEARAAARVAGFCTAKVLHADVTASPPYLVTEYVPGPTLDDVLAGGSLSGSDVEALAVGVAAALTAIHAAGLTHRDLKPSNVLLSRLGPKVIDFGIARALNTNGHHHTESGMLFGTLGWLAPEQLYGHSTQASDVFVWGLLIARAGTAWRPAPELRVTVPTAADLKALPATLAGTVTAALNMDPGSRPSARALLLRLCGSAEAGPVRIATKVLSRPWATPYPTRLAPPGSHSYPAPPSALPAIRPSALPAVLPYRPRPGRLPVHVPRPNVPPRRRRRWYTRKRFLLPIALIVILIILSSIDGQPPELPAGTARDGILEFTVTGWECGKQSLGKPPTVHQTQGQLCTVAVRARNFGNEPRRVHVNSQKLRDAAGRTYNADGGAWIYLEQARPFFNHEVNPGNELAGTLVYDIAKDATPQRLEVHDSPLSGGAPLALP